ncbi:MAG: 4-hydroxy-tetrahydrodipicolinate reductase, partial [Candidatus Weimeria sp.]|nr:4-hydroxy-tetrahydrodipicolinate reductase [Candidatus Weimeria sp.]
MVRAIMNGANGHMGRVITDLCREDENIEIVAGIDPFDGVDNDYPVFPTPADCTVEADVIIDFSNVKAVDALLDYSVEKQIPVVLCTTGLSDE